MKRIINFRAINIFKLELGVWEYGYHNHNFYELILVEKGVGIHCRNKVNFSYKPGDIFLLTPADYHEFIIQEHTQFIYLKFTDQYISELIPMSSNQSWKSAVHLLLKLNHVSFEPIVRNVNESNKIFSIVKILLSEFRGKNVFSSEIIQTLFIALLSVLIREINHPTNENKWLTLGGEKIDQILSYINMYALDKERMRVNNLARKFAMSENYISIFVKKHSGLSIQSHIMHYKMRAAEKLLKESQYNINEIAVELGFSDAGHLNKMIRRYFSCTPSAMRNK